LKNSLIASSSGKSFSIFSMVFISPVGFNRMWQGSGQVFDSVELHLPDVMFETQAAFIRVPPSARAECMEKGLDFKEGLHAAGHAVLNVLPLYLLCNTKDIAAECETMHVMCYIIMKILFVRADRICG
jgi:DEAD/DEAH box helicase domain-containing protein